MKELVSVIMCVFNEKIETIECSINSILNQTYSNIELIIIDDNPDDELLKEYLLSLKDCRIKCIFNDKNYKPAYSRNKGIDISRGKYIAIMDADDISLPNRIETQIEYYKKKNCDILGSFYYFINDDNKIIKTINLPKNNESITKLLLKGINCVGNPTIFVEKKIISKLKYRNIDYCEDYDMLLRATLLGYRINNIPKYLLKYRIRRKSISSMNASKQFLVMKYLHNNQNRISCITNEEIKNEISEKLIKKYNSFLYSKFGLINGNIMKKIQSFIELLFNKYFYLKFVSKVYYLFIMKICEGTEENE